jgi:hypothetical protein
MLATPRECEGTCIGLHPHVQLVSLAKPYGRPIILWRSAGPCIVGDAAQLWVICSNDCTSGLRSWRGKGMSTDDSALESEDMMSRLHSVQVACEKTLHGKAAAM